MFLLIKNLTVKIASVVVSATLIACIVIFAVTHSHKPGHEKSPEPLNSISTNKSKIKEDINADSKIKEVINANSKIEEAQTQLNNIITTLSIKKNLTYNQKNNLMNKAKQVIKDADLSSYPMIGQYLKTASSKYKERSNKVPTADDNLSNAWEELFNNKEQLNETFNNIKKQIKVNW